MFFPCARLAVINKELQNLYQEAKRENSKIVSEKGVG